MFGGLSCNSNIFIKTTPHTHIHTLFYYIHIFLFDKLYKYTHSTKKKKKKMRLAFSIKIMFDDDLSLNKIDFYNFLSEIIKKCHFQYK